MNWLDVLQIVGFSSIFSGLFLFIIQRYYKKKDKKRDKIEIQTIKRTELEEQKERQESEIIIQISEELTSIREGINDFIKEREKTKVTQDAINGNINEKVYKMDLLMNVLIKTLQVILKDRIIQMYNYYYKEKKYMPIYARESLENMLTQYHATNGNGVIDDLAKKMFSLPTEYNFSKEE